MYFEVYLLSVALQPSWVIAFRLLRDLAIFRQESLTDGVSSLRFSQHLEQLGTRIPTHWITNSIPELHLSSYTLVVESFLFEPLFPFPLLTDEFLFICELYSLRFILNFGAVLFVCEYL